MRSLSFLFGATLVACNADTFSSPDGGASDAASDTIIVSDGFAGDGGGPAAWQDLSLTDSSAKLNGVWGRGNDDVYVVGDNGLIANWNGTNWTPLAGGQTSHALQAVTGDATREIVVGRAGTEVVLLGGASATFSVAAGTPDLLGVSFAAAPSDTAWAVGASAVILYSSSVWSDHSALFPAMTCNAIFDRTAACNGSFVRDVAGTTGSTDVDVGTSKDLYAVWAGAAGKVVAGQGGALAVTAGGLWAPFNTSKPDFTGVWWDAGHLYLTSVDGNVYEASIALTSTTTPSLTPTKIGSGNALHAITATGATNDRYLWVVGEAGTVFRKAF